MDPKPRGWDRHYAEWFDDETVVRSYRHRPDYPSSMVGFLARLANAGSVLDAGCGPGDIARPLARLVRRVDAVDLSPRMIAAGRCLPGGHAENLTWLESPIEDAALNGPYELIVAGDSVHWFDWPVVMPRFAQVLAPLGHLGIVTRDWIRHPELSRRLRPIYSRYGANLDFRPLDPIVELERRSLFVRSGEHTTPPQVWRPTIEEVIGCHHSQNGFDAERMDPEGVRSFDLAVTNVLTELVGEGLVEEHEGRFDLDVTATVTWGRPRDSSADARA
jgi:SAM-dependent methyltransferase